MADTHKRGRTCEADKQASSVRTVPFFSSTLSHQSPSRAKTGRAARCVSLVSIIRLLYDLAMLNVDVHLCPSRLFSVRFGKSVGGIMYWSGQSSVSTFGLRP